MKNIYFIILLISSFIFTTTHAQDSAQRYNVKSGKVQYKISTSGKTMGQTVSGSGTATLLFSAYGAVELSEEQSSQTTFINIFGNKKEETSETHSMTKIDHGDIYVVDFNSESITRQSNMAMNMMQSQNKNGVAMGEDAMESMGGRKTGTESILGYTCDIWEVMGTKSWIYKGITLKIETNMLGISTVKEAVSADFNITISSAALALPDFNVNTAEDYMSSEEFNEGMEGMEEGLEQMKNMSYADWKKMVTASDPEMQSLSDEQLRQAYDAMQQMLKNL